MDAPIRTHPPLSNQPIQYGVIYQIREDKILIVAIMHLNRDPDSWKSRVSTP